MRKRVSIASVIAAATFGTASVLGAAGAVAQQPYPVKPIRVISSQAAGGGVDAMIRFAGAMFAEKTGQPFVVEARPGGNSIIAMDACAKSRADGYTICMIITQFVMVPLLYEKLPFNAGKDFDAITHLVNQDSVLVAHRSVPATTLSELIAYSKANPGKLNFVSFGPASGADLTIHWVEKASGVQWVGIGYKGAADSIPAIASGEVQLMFAGAVNLLPLLKKGSVRAMFSAGQQRSPVLPDIPTLNELGVSDQGVVNTWYGMFAPAGTPREVIRKLSDELTAIIRTPAMREKVLPLGLTPVGGTPEEFAAFLKTESERAAFTIKASGVKPEK